MLTKEDIDNQWESMKQLKEALRPGRNESSELEKIIEQATKLFPIESTVVVLGTGYTGVVVGYNTRLGGFTPGIRYPVNIRITASSNVDFQSSVGSIFEYSLTQLRLSE